MNLYLGWRPAGETAGSLNYAGALDDISIYARALSTNNIQSIFAAGSLGKCPDLIPPTFVTQPVSKTVTAGSNVIFTVAAAGSQPLVYHWKFNGTSLLSETSGTLTLPNVQPVQAGTYSVIASNVAGVATSSIATLKVLVLPTTVKIVSGSAAAGTPVAVPVTMIANGRENAVGFSINFDPALLQFQGVTPGSNALQAMPLINSSLAASGKVGIALAMNSGLTFGAGNLEIAELLFTATVRTTPATATLSFGDTPVLRQVSDAAGAVVPATYTGGSVSIAAASFEGDVSPRPNGDKATTITDWVLVGRYSARLDYPTNAAEYQRADCAPRITLGDGAIKVSDWVQAGRYAAGLDPLTIAGGPAADAIQAAAAPSGARMGPQLRTIAVADAAFMAGETRAVSVELIAEGNESGVGFSVAFDSQAFAYAGSVLGGGAAGATVQVNETQAASGKLGFALMRNAGSSFNPGTAELVRINLRARHSSMGEYPVALGDFVVPCEVADVEANTLTASYVSGTAIISAPPRLSLDVSGENLVLSWPDSDTDFTLQTAGDLSSSGNWSNVTAEVVVSNGECKVVVPMPIGPQFYRLLKP
jgi:hypothetical protein